MGLEEAIELACDGPFEAALDLAGAAALSAASGDVFAGARVGPHAGENDVVQGAVELPIAAAREPVASQLA